MDGRLHGMHQSRPSLCVHLHRLATAALHEEETSPCYIVVSIALGGLRLVCIKAMWTILDTMARRMAEPLQAPTTSWLKALSRIRDWVQLHLHLKSLTLVHSKIPCLLHMPCPHQTPQDTSPESLGSKPAIRSPSGPLPSSNAPAWCKSTPAHSVAQSAMQTDAMQLTAMLRLEPQKAAARKDAEMVAQEWRKADEAEWLRAKAQEEVAAKGLLNNLEDDLHSVEDRQLQSDGGIGGGVGVGWGGWIQL
jgi:hypothetical protein